MKLKYTAASYVVKHITLCAWDRPAHDMGTSMILTTYYYCYYYYYLLQLSFNYVAVVLTLVTNKNKYT